MVGGVFYVGEGPCCEAQPGFWNADLELVPSAVRIPPGEPGNPGIDDPQFGHAYGLSDDGDVVGRCRDLYAGPTFACLWTEGEMIRVDDSQMIFSDINRRGDIVGSLAGEWALWPRTKFRK